MTTRMKSKYTIEVLCPLAVGDLVRVIEGTDDPKLPASRTGLIVEVVQEATVVGTGIYMVRFSTYNLKFHAMFLERIS
jgi:hypothetical protein